MDQCSNFIYYIASVYYQPQSNINCSAYFSAINIQHMFLCLKTVIDIHRLQNYLEQ